MEHENLNTPQNPPLQQTDVGRSTSITAKEKANELIEKYLKLDIEIGGQYDGYLTMKMHDAKQCALIAVDEMIIQNGELYLLGLAKDYYIEKNAYLFDVKSELQSL